MNIKVITVGKLKEKYLRDGVQEYVKRLGAYAHVELIQVPDSGQIWRSNGRILTVLRWERW